MNTYKTVAGGEPDPNVRHEPRTIEHTREGVLHMMTEIEDGVFVAWGACARCQRSVANCPCTQGPMLPEHIKRWRDQRFEASMKNRRAVVDLKPVLAAAQDAQNAANGNSNDSEIDLLREALDAALGALGLDLPEGVDPDEEDDDADEDGVYRCEGCGRDELTCSKDPCPDVIADRGDDDEEETPEPETPKQASLREDVGAGLTAALEQVRSAKRGNTDAES